MPNIDKNIFREYDIRGVVGSQLSDENVPVIVRAICRWLTTHGAASVAIGRDARESSPRFSDIAIRELSSLGLNVVSIGLVPTPLLYHTVYTTEVDAGVMITGSHNPASHNGFKILLGEKTLFGDEIREIGELAHNAPPYQQTTLGRTSETSVIDRYLADLRSKIDVPSRRLKVAIDAGNGTAGLTAAPLYRALGHEVIELYTVPDASFPNHEPDPSNETNLADLKQAVIQNAADVGLAFDGDGDRLTVIDGKGDVWWGDRLLTLFAREVLQKHPGSIIISEAKCSQTLFDDIERNGGVPILWKAGHSIIKAKMQESRALLAGEMSGHFFFADRYYGFDDACYAGARLLEILAASDTALSEMLSDIPLTFTTPEIRVNCPESKKQAVVDGLVEKYSGSRDVITVDGARVTFPNGWGIVRPSNTQAILVLRFEANTDEHLAAIRSEVETAVHELLA